MIKIIPQTDSSSLQKAIEICQTYNWLIFTSFNGITLFFEKFKKLAHDIRHLAGVKIAVVGKESANLLQQNYHLKAELIAPQSTAESLSKALVSLNLSNQKILLIQGNLASPLLQKSLTEAGTEVHKIEVYRTELETRDIFQTRARLEAEGVDWIIFTSASTVEHWHQLNLTLPKPWCALSIGPVTSEKLKQFGYTSFIQSDETSLDGIILTLLKEQKLTS